MTEHSEQAWLEAVRIQILRGELSAAQSALTQALTAYPASLELRRTQAGILQQTGRLAEAESLLRELLVRSPDDIAAGFSLGHILAHQARTAAAAEILRGCCTSTRLHSIDPNLAIKAIEMLDDCDRKQDAMAIAESALKSHPEEPRLHAYAGMLAIQLGKFEIARQHYLFALQNDPRAVEWHVPIGLSSAQRYQDAAHPDFTIFHTGLNREDLSDLARAELHFALGKAYDDVGEFAEAARYFQTGNTIRKCHSVWSRKAWRRSAEARLAASRSPCNTEPTIGFSPIFVVGMPRSGTTLLAEQLGRLSGTCNRGEQPWLARLALKPDLNGSPDRKAFQRAAAEYATRVRQDDAGSAHWFIDKQPLNFRYVDLAMAMFPDARIIHCRRDSRDTALSLWMQCFLEDVQGYSYDFDDIALVMRDCEKLMALWHKRYPNALRSLHYEDFVASPRNTIDSLAAWIGIPNDDSRTVVTTPANVISTASLWQARQPVHTRSVGRWKHYAPHIPALLKLPDY